MHRYAIANNAAVFTILNIVTGSSLKLISLRCPYVRIAYPTKKTKNAIGYIDLEPCKHLYNCIKSAMAHIKMPIIS